MQQFHRSRARVVAVGLGLVVVVLASAVRAPAGGGPGCASERAWVDDEAGRMVFFAVLEGLYLDGLQQDVVEALLAGPGKGPDAWVFVPGCPICAPAEAALRTYASRGPLLVKKPADSASVRDTFGAGLEREVAASLCAGSRPERLAALQLLVQRWVAARMDRLRLTESERTDMRLWMEDAAKRGATRLDDLRRSDPAAAADWEACAVCDGAADACPADGR